MKKIIALALFILVVALVYPGPSEEQHVPATVAVPPVTPTPSPVAAPAPRIAPPPLVTRPQFQKAVTLGEKVLHSKKELAEFRALLASPALLEEGVHRLTDISESALGPEAEIARMQTVDYLNSALTWKQNPQRDVVLNEIKTVLNRSIDDIKAPLVLKRSFAGDAMELYFVLFTHEPTMARELLEHADAKQQRLFRFATKMAEQKSQSKI